MVQDEVHEEVLLVAWKALLQEGTLPERDKPNARCSTKRGHPRLAVLQVCKKYKYKYWCHKKVGRPLCYLLRFAVCVLCNAAAAAPAAGASPPPAPRVPPDLPSLPKPCN